jgi:hypothetical protein
MRTRPEGLWWLVALVSLGGPSGCGDDAGSGDAGARDAARVDGGAPIPADSGRGPGPAAALTRVAHLVPNAPAVDLCVYFTAGGAFVAGTTPIGPLAERAGTSGGIPFRGVSSYVNLFTAAAEYTVRVYAETDVPTDCPAFDDDAVAPMLAATIEPGSLVAGRYYTIGAVGFLDEAGDDPSWCGPTFSMPCAAAEQQPHFEVYADSVAVSDGTATGMRFLHAVPNLSPLDVCHDADGPAGAADPEELFASVAFPSAPEYLERDPITAGTISLHIDIPGLTDGMTCPDVPIPGAGGATTRIAVIPVPWPDPAGTAAVPGSVKTFEPGRVATVFTTGRAGTAPGSEGSVLVVPFADTSVTP